MSQEVKVEESGMQQAIQALFIKRQESNLNSLLFINKRISDEEDEGGHKNQFNDENVKDDTKDETLPNEESKVETNDDNLNKNNESSQMNNNNFTSISKQNEDSDDINFHEESYNKESILQNDEHDEGQEQHQIITEEDDQSHNHKVFSKEQQSRELTNMIIEASSNSSHFTLHLSQTDDVKTKKSAPSQDEFEVYDNNPKSESQDNQASAQKRSSINKQKKALQQNQNNQDDQEEEKTAENQVQGEVHSSAEYIYRDQHKDQYQKQEQKLAELHTQQEEGDLKEEDQQLQVVHQDGYSLHPTGNQAFDQKSPAQNTEIVQKNLRKESIMVDHQVEDSMFHMENKINNNNGDGKSSSASDNGDEIIQNYINENQIPHQLKMIRNKSNDSEDPYNKSGGNFFVTHMLQINQQQNENPPPSSGGVVIIGGANSDNYSYNSPEVITHKLDNKSSTPDIMDINFSSSNQTSSFGFSKLTVEKISSQNDNNQNSNNNNNNMTNNNVNLQGMVSIDSKQYSASNSYELNYSIKMMHNSNDPISIDDSKRNIKQFTNDEDGTNDDDEEHNGEIILQQDHTTEFSKHILQTRVDKIDTLQQMKNKNVLKTATATLQGKEQGKKTQKNDYYFITSEIKDDKQKVELVDKPLGERRFSQGKDQEEIQSRLSQEKIKTPSQQQQQQKGNSGKATQTAKDIFSDFFNSELTMKGETEQSHFATNADQQQYSITTGRNEDTQIYANLRSEENQQFNNKKEGKIQQAIRIQPNQLRDESVFSVETSKDDSKQINYISKQGKQQLNKGKYDASQLKGLSQADQLTQDQKQLKQDGIPTGNENPLSLSDLNSFSSRLQQNSLVHQSRALRNVNIIHKFLIIFNCILYGYIIPQYPNLISKPIVTAYLFKQAVLSFVFKKQFDLDLSVYYKIALGLINILLTDPNYSTIINILFFGQFLFSLWSLNAISIRIRSITDVIRSSFRPNLEIFGFLVILILLFNVIFNVFNLTEISPSGIFSFSSIEYFKYYVLSIFQRDEKFEFVDSNKQYNLTEPQIYLSFTCAFICLYFMKIVVENLLSIVQKVSQEQYYEYVGPHYSVGKFAVFKENERMNYLYNNNKAMYTLLQGCCIISYFVMQELVASSSYQFDDNVVIHLLAAFLRYFSLVFILYEVSIDVVMSSAISIFKNTIYILIMWDPTYYRLFAIFIFYGVISHIAYFKVVTSHIATLLLDFTVVVFLNFFIYLSYVNCNQFKAIPSYIPMIVMFFFFSPLLKGMMLRYSEIFEIEEDEDTILSSLNAPTEQQELQNQQNDEYDEFDEEIDYQDEGRIQDTETSTNQGIKRNLQSNKVVNKYSTQKSFFIFSKRGYLRAGCLKLVSSPLFQQIKQLLLLIISIKEFFYFLCSAFQISYHNEFINIISYWERFVEPSLLGFIILMNSISYGFLINKGSYLTRSFRNLIFFLLFIIIYGIQQLVQDAYFGFLRVVYLLYLLPFGIQRLADITSAISRSKKILLQIFFIFSTIFLIHEIFVTPSIKDKSDYVIIFINQLIYLFSINFFVSAILVEYSKQQLRYQNPNIIWTSIKQKIANHKFNFYFIKQKNINSQSSFLYKFLKSQYHNLIISIITGLFYLTLFLIGLVEEYFSSNQQLYNFVTNYYLKSILISGFTYFIILYCLINISVYNLAPFFCSSALNKSFILLVVLVIDIFSGFLSNYNLRIQFILQLPMLLRTKYMFPIVKFHKCIFRQGIVTLVVSHVMIVCIAFFLKDSRTSVVEYMLILFNLSPNLFIVDQSEGWRNLLFILVIYLSNGIFNSILLLDIIRKFDLNESAQAKNKFKQILSIFESIWDKYKYPQNPSLMKANNLIYFLVKFDKAIEEEESGKDDKKKQKPLKITYLKRITKMRIKINDDQCLYYKDLLFYLISEKFNRVQSDENYCYGSMSSFNNMNSSVFYNFAAEDLELSQLSSRRMWKVYNPIKQQLYATLILMAWKRYTDIVINSGNDRDIEFDEDELGISKQNKSNYEEEEEDSIFFDPNMVPAETIQQQSLHSRFDAN